MAMRASREPEGGAVAPLAAAKVALLEFYGSEEMALQGSAGWVAKRSLGVAVACSSCSQHNLQTCT